MVESNEAQDVVITEREVEARVKWFNPLKGFGFVQTAANAPDAFLHVSVLQQLGRTDAAEGAKVVCDLGQGRKGLQVVAIYDMEAPEPSATNGMGEDGDQADEELSQPFTGRVKFFNADKGFGFVVPDSGGPDVFVSARVLHQSGLRGLEPERTVRLRARMGPKGPMAESVELV